MSASSASACIGTGYMGKCHALAWNAVASVFGDVDAAASRSAGRELAGIGRPQGARTRFCSRHRRLALARDAIRDIDVVSITTPNAFHPDMAIAALEAGKHVWCEKPMATKLADAERMLAPRARPARSRRWATTTSRTR